MKIIANNLSPMYKDNAISNIIHFSEEPFVIDELTTRQIEWEPYQETVLKASFADTTGMDRIKQLTAENKTDDLNKEEHNNMVELCCDYADYFSHVRVVQKGSPDIDTEFNEFRAAENKPIFNSKIVETEVDFGKVSESENIIIIIAKDKIITHPKIREITRKLDLNRVHFTDDNRFYTYPHGTQLIIFYCITETHATPWEAEVIYQAINDIKTFCVINQINSFSTIKFDGPTSLNSYLRIRTMFRYVFKNTDIIVKIYTGERLTDEEKQIIYEHHVRCITRS